MPFHAESLHISENSVLKPVLFSISIFADTPPTAIVMVKEIVLSETASIFTGV